MPFEKGHSYGRPKGSQSEKTKLWNQMGEYLITEGAARAVQIMQECEDEKFIIYFDKFLEYFKPKLQRSEITGADGGGLVIEVKTKSTQFDKNKNTQDANND